MTYLDWVDTYRNAYKQALEALFKGLDRVETEIILIDTTSRREIHITVTKLPDNFPTADGKKVIAAWKELEIKIEKGLAPVALTLTRKKVAGVRLPREFVLYPFILHVDVLAAILGEKILAPAKKGRPRIMNDIAIGKLYAGGKSLRQIAVELGFTHGAVQAALKRLKASSK